VFSVLRRSLNALENPWMMMSVMIMVSVVMAVVIVVIS